MRPHPGLSYLYPGIAEPQFGSVSVLISVVSTSAVLGFGDPGKNRNDNADCGLGVAHPCQAFLFIRVHLRSSVVPIFLSLSVLIPLVSTSAELGFSDPGKTGMTR